MNLFPFFSSSSYTGYGDDEEGFYHVYQAAFDEIEELEVQEDDNGSSAPRMGGSSTLWTDGPGQFYAYWENFSTCRSFAWCDKYNPNDAPNRQVKRAIEQENKKERSRGKRVFNETVRRLAGWAKKRDPRQIAHQQRLAEEATRKAEEDKKKAAEMKRLREEARAQAQTEDIEVDEALDDMYMEMELMKEFRCVPLTDTPQNQAPKPWIQPPSVHRLLGIVVVERPDVGVIVHDAGDCVQREEGEEVARAVAAARG